MIELTEKDILRFWSKVDVKGNLDECWEWQTHKKWYGIFRIKNKCFGSHRIAYTLYYGQIPEKMFICHKCDNPSCVNPHHLFLGTQKDNIIDCSNKNRLVDNSGEKCGTHKLTGQEILEIRQKYIPKIYTQQKLAKEYGVCPSQISLIVNNKRWKHI